MRVLPVLSCLAFLCSLSCAPAPSVDPPAVATQPAPLVALRQSPGEVVLVESAPLETNLEHPDIPDAYQVWPEMIRGATRTLDLAEFYISDAPNSRLEPVIQAIEAAADRGVAVRLLADAGFARTYPETLDRLAARHGITVRRFEVGKIMGGVLHAKYFIVDGRETFLGSQNFDWRSLAHIQEIGVRLRDAAATAPYARVFEMDWALAGGQPRESLQTAEDGPLTFPVIAAGAPATATPVFSPKGFLPDPRTWALPRLVALLDGAKRSVDLQVLTYRAGGRDGSPFTELDDALRRAAARGVAVRILVSDWDKKKATVESVQRLARVPGISARFLDIPAWSGGFVPFARVAHAKYLVVDGARAWVGTSNWEADYFTKSRNVGLIVDGEAFATELDRVFEGGFKGPYTEVVDPDKTYVPPKVNEKKE